MNEWIQSSSWSRSWCKPGRWNRRCTFGGDVCKELADLVLALQGECLELCGVRQVPSFRASGCSSVGREPGPAQSLPPASFLHFFIFECYNVKYWVELNITIKEIRKRTYRLPLFILVTLTNNDLNVYIEFQINSSGHIMLWRSISNFKLEVRTLCKPVWTEQLYGPLFWILICPCLFVL